MNKGVVEEIEGDLFSCLDTASLAHCVSADLEMGKGIAVHFKKRFGNVDLLKSQDGAVGGGAVLKTKSGHHVYYLITKERYWHKPTLETLRASCEWMRDHAVEHKVKCLAMPKIGCGLDRLDCPTVRAVVEEVFKGTGICVKIFVLPGTN